MPKLTPAAAEARRRIISSAAHRCLLKKGFGRTTMRDIAREANLSLGGVYSHFRSKAELMQFLALQGRQETRKILDHVPGDGANLSDLAAALVRKLTTEECLRSVRVDLRLWGEALHTPELRKLVREAFASARAPMADAARRAKKLSPENTAG
ncbi:MAG: TetR/AcrR family transcriptional regulator, partial [Vicinamibacteria bacterium]